MKKRLGIISLFVLLFMAFVCVFNHSYQQGKDHAYILVEKKDNFKAIPSESGVFTRAEYALDYSKIPIDTAYQRSLDTYYKNRAYHGAPPTIPHPVNEKHNIGGNTCLKCHENGGFVKKYNAYTPVTPHPELTNCRQCHVEKVTQTFFKEGYFAKVNAPEVGVNKALLTSPPVIPHQIQLRENCLACHAGPSSPKEIRVTHPERTNCRQCHVPSTNEMTKIKEFIRK